MNNFENEDTNSSLESCSQEQDSEGAVTQPEESNLEEELLNRIIAAGLNSLGDKIQYDSEQKALMDEFVGQSFDRIIPCFNLLNERVQLYAFRPHKEEFLAYMKAAKDGGE